MQKASDKKGAYVVVESSDTLDRVANYAKEIGATRTKRIAGADQTLVRALLPRGEVREWRLHELNRELPNLSRRV